MGVERCQRSVRGGDDMLMTQSLSTSLPEHPTGMAGTLTRLPTANPTTARAASLSTNGASANVGSLTHLDGDPLEDDQRIMLPFVIKLLERRQPSLAACPAHKAQRPHICFAMCRAPRPPVAACYHILKTDLHNRKTQGAPPPPHPPTPTCTCIRVCARLNPPPIIPPAPTPTQLRDAARAKGSSCSAARGGGTLNEANRSD